MDDCLWKDDFNAQTVKIIWFYFYDSRFKQISLLRQISLNRES